MGVVAHLKQHPADDAVEQIYVPHQQSPQRTMTLVIHSTTSEAALLAVVRAEVNRLDNQQPVQVARMMDEYLAEAMAPTRFAFSLLAGFAVVAGIVAAIALYGVMSYSVRERWAEIGVRLALGATPWRVRRGIVAEGALVIVAGLSVGVVGAFGLSRFLASQLYGVSATDPLMFAVIPVALALVSLGAVSIPAYRASKLDPSLALRGE